MQVGSMFDEYLIKHNHRNNYKGEFKMSFAENLKLIRKEQGITQEDLAEMLKVSRQAVSKWEAGAGYPETDKLLTIAKKLNVSLDFLMDNESTTDGDEPQEVVFPKTDNIKIMTFDGSQTVDCISVRYSRIVFSAKNEPSYILQAVDRVGFWGAHTIILGWYNDEESVKSEMEAIVKAMDQEKRTYKLKYFTVVEFKGIFGLVRRK